MKIQTLWKYRKLWKYRAVWQHRGLIAGAAGLALGVAAVVILQRIGSAGQGSPRALARAAEDAEYEHVGASLDDDAYGG